MYYKTGYTLNQKTAVQNNNRAWDFFRMTFVCKSGLDRHVNTINDNDTLIPVSSMVGSPHKYATKEILENPFRSDDRNIIK